MLRALFLGYLFSTFLPVGALAGTAAESALARAESLLSRYSASGYATAADEVLRVIQLAKDQGVLRLPVVRESVDSEQSVAEFGSTSGAWRLTGAVAKTELAFSVFTYQADNGNSFVKFHVVLPFSVSAFGEEGAEFKGTFFDFENPKGAQLGLNFTQDREIFSSETKERDRVYSLTPSAGECEERLRFWMGYGLEYNGKTHQH